MNFGNLVGSAGKFVKANGPEILTALGIGGVVSTAYLTGKASYEAARVIEWDERVVPAPEDRKERMKIRAQKTWKLYVPAGVSGVATIACIIGASRGNGRRTAAAVAAYSVVEKGFSEYREKVVEQIGENKEKKVRDAIAQDRITNNPPTGVIMIGSGDVLCCELQTGRYFNCDMEKLRKAQNDINEMVINQLYVPLDDFYELVGLPGTSMSSEFGWQSDYRLMELEFSHGLAPDGRPCLTFDYNYLRPLRM